MSKLSLLLPLCFFVAGLMLAFSRGFHEKLRTDRIRMNQNSGRAVGTRSIFDSALNILLNPAARVTATPKSYVIVKDFYLGSQTTPCKSPVTQGLSIGQNICYPEFNYDTNTTEYAKFTSNSTAATYTAYSDSACSLVIESHVAPIGQCAGDYTTKVLVSDTASISSYPGALFTTYATNTSCASQSGPIQGAVWVPTTTNNCFVYDTLANLGNSSSWTCSSANAVTYLAYNESSTCMYHAEGETFPSTAACGNPVPEQSGFATGWTTYSCNTDVPGYPSRKPTNKPTKPSKLRGPKEI